METRTYNDFSGGLYTDEPPFKLEENQFRALKNVFVSLKGSLRLRTGQRNLIPTLSGGPITGFTRFRTRIPTISGLKTARSYLIYGKDNKTYLFDETSLATTQIDPLYNARDFASFTGYAIYTTLSPEDTSDATAEQAIMRVWYGEQATLPLGLNEAFNSAPARGTRGGTSLTASISGGGGNLDTTDLDPISYIYTFYEGDTQSEGNPAGASLTPQTSAGSALLWSNSVSGEGFRVHVSNIPTALGLYRRVYRRGGRLSIPRMVKDITDSSTTDFVDNLGDLDVLGNETLSYYRDPGFGRVIAKMRDRMVSAFNTTVYVSTRNNPRENPLVVTDAANDGMRFDLDGDATNPILALTEFGGSCVVHRRKNMYILQGDDYDSMTCQKVQDVGIGATRSAVDCNGVYMWMAPDGMIWGAGDSGITKYGGVLETTLDSIPVNLLPYAAGAYYKNAYHLCVPNPGGVPYYFRFDFQGNKWTDLSASYLNATQLYSETGRGDLDELLFATTSGYRGVDGNAYNGIVSAFGDNGLSMLDFDVFSADLDMGAINRYKKYRHFTVRGKITAPVDAPVLTLYATQQGREGEVVVVTKSYPLNTTGANFGLLFDKDVDASLEGQLLAWRLSGRATYFELNEINIGFDWGEGANP